MIVTTFKFPYKITWYFLIIFMVCYNFAASQELEPRAFTNIPRGMNFVLLGYSYSSGNVLLDPYIPIEDLKSRLHTTFGAYVRSIRIFGLSGKVDVLFPGQQVIIQLYWMVMIHRDQ